MSEPKIIEAIEVKTSEELEKVLGKIESQGFRWCGGEKATDYTPKEKFPYLVQKWSDGDITYITYGEVVGKDIKISAEEFLRHEAITKDDILKAAATVCAKDESTQELIKAEPMMFVAFGIFAGKIAKELFGEEKENENARSN